MTEQNAGYEIPSQEEVKNDGEYSNNPLEAGNYLAKIGKIDFVKKPTWNNGGWDHSNLKWSYSLILLPYSLESGSTMKDTELKEVNPLTRWLFREINPFSMGFMPDNATPSFMRAIVAYLTGQNLQGRIKPDGFILLDSADNVVNDEETRNKFIAEQSQPLDNRPMNKAGYKAVPDIRMYEGKYIAISVEVDSKGRNKVSKFSRLPDNFNPTEDPEAIQKFQEGYQKMIDKRNNNANAVAQNTDVQTEEIKAEDIAF